MSAPCSPEVVPVVLTEEGTMTQQDLDAMPDSSSQAVGKWAVAATCLERTIGWIAFRNICIEYLTSVGGTQDQPPQVLIN